MPVSRSIGIGLFILALAGGQEVTLLSGDPDPSSGVAGVGTPPPEPGILVDAIWLQGRSTDPGHPMPLSFRGANFQNGERPPDGQAQASERARLRQPVKLVIAPDGSRLFVVNQRSGSLSIVDLKTGRVVAEHDLGKSLDDLAPLPDGRLLAIDREGDSLIALKVNIDEVTIEGRIAIDAPASFLVSRDGSRCVVASTNSRDISLIEINRDFPKSNIKKLDMPFAPLLMAWVVPGSCLVVADAYGGKMVVVDVARELLGPVRSIPAHNIRGLALSPDGRSVVVAHQTLSKLARSTFEDVHWGALVGNHVRILAVDAILNPDGDLLKGSRLIDLGRTGQAAADPGAVVFDVPGKMAVALSGVHEIGLINDTRSYAMKRVEVGGRPSSLVASPDGSVVYVADSLDDTISVVEVASAARIKTFSLGKRPELGPVERGERLFFDARLSHDGWMSCQSCHTDGRDNGQLADTLTDGGYGAPKRVSSLLGVGATGPWGWLGTTRSLEDQVRKSVETTMRGRPPSDAVVNDLTAYLRSLPPPKPRKNVKDIEAVARGRAIFEARKCADCHAPPRYTSEEKFDVGLVDEAGNHRFNPPSLRGVNERPPYLHDGRAAQLSEVFLKHRHPKTSSWSTAEVEDLVTFLKTL